MRLLDGAELAGYVKERQLRQVRALRLSWRVIPRLAIVQTIDDPVIDTYVRMKKAYGSDITVEVDCYKVMQNEVLATITNLNNDLSVHGIIVQLPLADASQTEAIVNAVVDNKDVDGLGEGHSFIPATAMAIDWLVAGYNVSLQGKKIGIVGNGRLVGKPLAALWQQAGYTLSVYDGKTPDLAERLIEDDIIVTATGVPGLINDKMIKHGAVVVDAGTAAEHGKIVGDLAASVRTRQDITITPEKGGVGPLTVSALFDNVIRAARVVADAKGQQDLS